LRLFLADGGLETHPRELARRLGRAAPPVVRELQRLEGLQVLTSKRVGALRRYRLADSPQAVAVRHLVALPGDPTPAADEDMSSHDGRLLALHARVAEHLRHDPDAVIARARANITRWQAIDPRGNAPWVRAWTEILDRGPAEVALAMLDPSPRMRELRQSSPFAGVLTMAERLTVLRRSVILT